MGQKRLCGSTFAIQAKTGVDRRKKAIIGGAAIFAAVAGVGIGSAHAAVVNATYSAAFETGGDAFTGSSFQAAGSGASANTPSDKFPAFGAVAFNAASFASLASTGVTASATLTATEFPSTSTSTGTHAGSIINIYFAESPQTPASTATGFADSYDATNPPGGFDATEYTADLVGTVTYTNTATTDAIPITLSSADVTYIDNTLTSGTGTFEFLAVATSATDSAKYDGSYTGGPATLTLNAAAVTPEPTSMLLMAAALAPMMLNRRRTSRGATDSAVK